MISGCAYCGILQLNETAFFQDTFALLVLIAPGTMFFTLWRIFVTNKSGPRGGVVVLGLDDSSSTHADLSLSGFSMDRPLTYCCTSILTFGTGLPPSVGCKRLRKSFLSGALFSRSAG